MVCRATIPEDVGAQFEVADLKVVNLVGDKQVMCSFLSGNELGKSPYSVL